jgi:hypothetical protein
VQVESAAVVQVSEELQCDTPLQAWQRSAAPEPSRQVPAWHVAQLESAAVVQVSCALQATTSEQGRHTDAPDTTSG